MATAHPFPVFIVKKFQLEHGSVKIHNHGLVFRRGEERWIYTKIVNMSTCSPRGDGLHYDTLAVTRCHRGQEFLSENEMWQRVWD